MADPNHVLNGDSNDGRKNPFRDPPKREPDLQYVATRGIVLVTAITKYLSTLPHPIEIVEELVAVVAVTSTLLTSLNSTLGRFPQLTLSKTQSFIAPLCHDVLFAFMLLGSKVDEARRMHVFEPNDVGLVRLPRSAWTLVMGNETRAAALRSRLYVEKYRVRVLIEAVSWVGLRGLVSRTAHQDDELKNLTKMLPLITERLVGVQKDYVPRLTGRKAETEVEVKVEKTEPMPKTEPTVVFTRETRRDSIVQEKEISKPISGKLSIRSMSTDSLASTCSSSSSETAYEDSIFEIWLLRRNELKRVPKSSTSIFGIKWYQKHSVEPASYYVKPVSSCLSEIKDVRKQCLGSLSDAEHASAFHKKICGMDEEAQWEIQRLLEAREAASSSDEVKRNWNLVAWMERPRRYITNPGNGKAKWYKKAKKEAVEWVMVLKGETIDRRSRALPNKHEDPWNPRPRPSPPVQQRAQVQQPPVLTPQQQQVGTVLRHVEHRRAMSVEEAEKKMDELVRELFVTVEREGEKDGDAMGQGL